MNSNRVLTGIAVMAATIMQVLDTTIINVALPNMAGQLDATPDNISWVLTSYLIASAIIMPLTGFITDRIGQKRFLLISIAGFVITSMLCGMATSLCADGAVPLPAGRVRRGAGAAVAIHHAADLPRRAARQGDGDLEHGRDGRADHGTDAGRLAHRSDQLALDVLHQPAGRHPVLHARHAPCA